MKAIQLRKPGGLDNLFTSDFDAGKPGRGEILVRLHASSLNFHDYVVVKGMVPVKDGLIPMSDAAGVVVETGEDVTDYKAGDHVVSLFWPDWQGGDPLPEKLRQLPGDRSDGYAREMVVAPASAFTRAPAGYSHVEAATLTCAGLTAWRSLVVDGHIAAGETVLVQGTGGVSIFALQFAKMFGATVIATSSSDAKLERLKALGADHLIHYKSTPAWGAEVLKITSGRGVDHVVEVGGAGTMEQSIVACRLGGHIAMIGALAGFQGPVSTATLMSKQIRLIGLMVGNRDQQNQMIRAVEANRLKPVIDRQFALEELADAFRHQESGAHFGKICLSF